MKGRTVLQLGFFALTNREYSKIMRRQKEICQNIKKIPFTYSEFEVYRELLGMILKFNESERANIDLVI